MQNLAIALILSLISSMSVAQTYKVTVETDRGTIQDLPFDSEIAIRITQDEAPTVPDPTPAPSLPTYCSNPAPNVNCSSTLNFDSIYEDRGEVTLRIRPGKTLAVPFTITGNSTAYGLLQYTSSQSLTPGTVPWAWFSYTPGGPAISKECERGQEYRGNHYWSQDVALGACYLGESPAVVYANFTVPGYSTDVYFDVARNAAPL